MDNYYYAALLHGTTIEIVSEPYANETEAFQALDRYMIENKDADGLINGIVVHIPAKQVQEFERKHGTNL